MGKIGVIGGSGLYDIEGLKNINSIKVDTPFGRPSDELISGSLGNKEVVFLPRHGKGHKILPSELNYRANIYAMKKLGVERIISVSAVGSLKKELKPGDFVLVDQFVDRTNQARPTTFFGEGIVAHVALADPVCLELKDLLFATAQELNISAYPKGSYINMEGPAFSTRAESMLYRSWGMDVIGMTNMAEARLAREAEICYATVAMVTDYDCWYAEEESVNVELILETMRRNVIKAKGLIKAVIGKIAEQRKCPCAQSLKNAIVTASGHIPAETRKKLSIIIAKYV